MAPKKSAAAAVRILMPDMTEEEVAALEKSCKRCLSKKEAGGDATVAFIMAIDRSVTTIPFLHRMITVHGADANATCLHFYNKPPTLELLARTGHADLRFNGDELLHKAVENKKWHSVDYLINFAGADPSSEEILKKAITIGDREVFCVLLSGLNPQDATCWTASLAEELIKHKAWEFLTDVWRRSHAHFFKILSVSNIRQEAMKERANHLSFCALLRLAEKNIYPDISEEESKPSKHILKFVVKQLASVHAAQQKQIQIEEEEEEELETPLKPSALSAYESEY